jgi:hypothetical protein
VAAALTTWQPRPTFLLRESEEAHSEEAASMEVHDGELDRELGEEAQERGGVRE